MFAGGSRCARGPLAIEWIAMPNSYMAGLGGFELFQRVAAAGRSTDLDEPILQHTIINKIMNWNFGLRDEDRDAMIMWVNGAAGTGKSAIPQSRPPAFVLFFFFF